MTYEKMKELALTKCSKLTYVLVRKSISLILKDAGIVLTDIGKFLGKDHSTILYYINAMTFELQQSEYARRIYIKCKQHTDRLINEVEELLNGV